MGSLKPMKPRLKPALLCCLALAAMPAAGAPVPASLIHISLIHISLKAAAAAPLTADGFVTLGAVADLSGGDKAARSRFAAVPVARAPLSGETRQLTRGDLALKLRQAGINPDTQAVFEGAEQAVVTTDCPAAPPAALSIPPAPAGTVTPASVGTAAPTGPIVHPGDSVTILVQTDGMTITAPATARESGRAGDMIRVHRDGTLSDLSVQVLDSQTVQMEI